MREVFMENSSAKKLLDGVKITIIQYAIYSMTKTIYEESLKLIDFNLLDSIRELDNSEEALKINSFKDCYQSYVAINLMKLFGKGKNDSSSLFNNFTDEQVNDKKLFDDFYNKNKNDFDELRRIRNKIFAHFDINFSLMEIQNQFIVDCFTFLDEYFNRQPIIKLRNEFVKTK